MEYWCNMKGAAQACNDAAYAAAVFIDILKVY